MQRFLDLAMSSLGSELDLHIEEVAVVERSRLAGIRLSDADLRKRLGILVLAIRRQTGKIEFNPSGDDEIRPGDFLIAMGEAQQLKISKPSPASPELRAQPLRASRLPYFLGAETPKALRWNGPIM